MPIYAYKCTACGHAQDVLRKISDKPLTVCPECHQETYTKQVTAAGFQLKGSGWYVTDFRNNGGGDKGSTKISEPAPAVTAADGAASAASTGSEGGSGASSPSNGSTSAPAAPAATPASNSSASTSGASSSPTPASSTSSSSKPTAGGSAA